MTKRPIPNAFRRGFTLIELMIVIVILGILMGAILPRLTGGQARARDVGRQGDLGNIQNALKLYFKDHGEYPNGSGNGPFCLDPDSTDTDEQNIMADLGPYFSDGQVPTPPSASQSTQIGGTTCSGTYLYVPLRAGGIANSGFLIGSDVESYQNANAVSQAALGSCSGTCLSSSIDATSNFEVVRQAMNGVTDTQMQTADDTEATSSVFVIVDR